MESEGWHEIRCVISMFLISLLADASAVGRVNLCSPDHVSLLIHKTFNASIPRNHIPGDKWEFQYGLPENDPEFGPDAPMEEKRSEQEGAGKWVNRQSGQRLGGELGDLEFTVIGCVIGPALVACLRSHEQQRLTVANEMLSIQGSIQLDPFSPKHAMRTDATRQPEETETEADKLEDESEEDGSSDIDTFRSLGRKAVQAATADLQERKLENSRSQAMRKKKQEVQGKDETILPKGKKARK